MREPFETERGFMVGPWQGGSLMPRGVFVSAAFVRVMRNATTAELAEMIAMLDEAQAGQIFHAESTFK